MLIETATLAARAADIEITRAACVFGSAYGELQIALSQLAMMCEGDGIVSPAQFKNSVHNTASGLFSIATHNRGFTTAIAAGEATFQACVIEALGLLHGGHDPVVLAVADEPAPEPLSHFTPFPEMGAAVVLSRFERGALASALIEGSLPPPVPGAWGRAGVGGVTNNPASWAVHFIDAARQPIGEVIPLGPEPRAWRATLGAP